MVAIYCNSCIWKNQAQTFLKKKED
uniref:Uncharacterized protein n=1 Tax=Rhizophora mucronata TaxID=61149 RepID=A0A2P2PQ41_RHIMU